MSFQQDLAKYVMEYTDFKVNGDRIIIPYYQASGHGKPTPAEILALINKWMGTTQKTKEQIQVWVDANKESTGVDCSGLVYYVINEATNGAVRTFFEKKLGISNIPYSYGVNAANLTNSSYGKKISKAKDITPGCVFRFYTQGGHVLVVYAVMKDVDGNVDSIWYAHSDTTAHTGYITINNQDADLNSSSNIWHDIDSDFTDAKCKQNYQYTLLLEPVSQFVQ